MPQVVEADFFDPSLLDEISEAPLAKIIHLDWITRILGKYKTFVGVSFSLP
jgi:hypothetical protein